MKRTTVEAPKRILVRGVNWLGDAVMTMPVFHRLREAWPDAHIAVLTLPKLAELYCCLPAVDTVLTLTRDEPMLSVASRLRRENFDTGLILTNSARTALPFWLAGIPQRIGYAGQGRTWLLTHPARPEYGNVIIRRRSIGEIKRLVGRQVSVAFFPSSLFDTFLAKPAAPAVHHLQRYLDLAALLGADAVPMAPRLTITEAEIRAVSEHFQLPAPDSGRPIFGLNPGAEYGPAKCWPEERFVNAAVALQQRLDCRWILVGGTSDVPLANRIVAGIRAAGGEAVNREKTGVSTLPASSGAVWNLAGRTSLRELCATLRVCDLLLTNDTGPMHVAAAVGTPVVVPFGSTSPALTGPGLPGSNTHRLLTPSAPCAPCFQRLCPIDFRCMNDISVQQVLQAVESLYEQSHLASLSN